MTEKSKGRGVFHYQHIRDGKIIHEEDIPNAVMYAGLNLMLNAMFRATTPVTAWYAGLVDNSGFTGTANTDTMASHSGWAEFTGYSESVHQTWSPGAASAGSLSNGTQMTFTISASTAAIWGIFITSNNAKSASSGTLWCAAAFSSVRSVVAGDLIKVTYTYTIV